LQSIITKWLLRQTDSQNHLFQVERQGPVSASATECPIGKNRQFPLLAEWMLG
jgi:hypothetical protein